MSLPQDSYNHRSIDQIVRGLGAAHICPASVQERECAAIMKRCAKTVRLLQAKASREEKKGRHRIARTYQRQLFECLPARLLAAYKACRAIDARRRKKFYGPSRPIAFEHIWKVAERLKDPHAPSHAIHRSKPKPRGGFRRYLEFDEFGTAKHKLFVNAILPFASFHSSQFALRRGRSAACESLLKVMNRLLLPRTRFIQLDVTDFYGSISRSYLEEILPAPVAIIRSTLFLSGWNIDNRKLGCTMDRRGVPQGSAASSLVAEMVMANVLRDSAGQLADLLWLHSYSDNVGGFVLPNKDDVALIERLRNAFSTHPAGPFRIRLENSPVSRPSRWLGYSFIKSPRKKACAFLPTEVWQLKEMELTTAFANAETLQDRLNVCVRLQSYCSAFKLAAESRELFSEVIKFIRADLSYREGQSRDVR